MKVDFFTEMTNDELRAKADEIYEDLIDSAQLVPNTPWHEACFGALHMACTEMQKRQMPPPTATGFLQ
jgi:hypothetical protein